MALKVNVNKRKVIAGENEGKEFFYGNVVTDGTMDFNELCKTISAACTITQADVIGVLEALRQIYRKHLLNGDTVDLGDIGTVRLTASSHGVSQQKDFHISMMKPVRLLYRPGKQLLQAASEATYRRNAQNVVKDECPLAHEDDF